MVDGLKPSPHSPPNLTDRKRSPSLFIHRDDALLATSRISERFQPVQILPLNVTSIRHDFMYSARQGKVLSISNGRWASDDAASLPESEKKVEFTAAAEGG